MGTQSGSRLQWPAEFLLLPLSYSSLCLVFTVCFCFGLLADSYPLPPYPVHRNSCIGAHKHTHSLTCTHVSPSPYTVPSCCCCHTAHSSPFSLGATVTAAVWGGCKRVLLCVHSPLSQYKRTECSRTVKSLVLVSFGWMAPLDSTT